MLGSILRRPYVIPLDKRGPATKIIEMNCSQEMKEDNKLIEFKTNILNLCKEKLSDHLSRGTCTIIIEREDSTNTMTTTQIISEESPKSELSSSKVPQGVSTGTTTTTTTTTTSNAEIINLVDDDDDENDKVVVIP